MDWMAFANWVDGPDNPLLQPTDGLITRAVLDHPLYAALNDLADRLGIRQGKFKPALGDTADRDPLADVAAAERGGAG
ncbi:MAG TPA: hypothetical protein VII06_24760 [Chloroflexota bacterium]|jgi:hypothetical protein